MKPVSNAQKFYFAHFLDLYFFNLKKKILCSMRNDIHIGSYRSAHILLNLLNKLRKRDKMPGFPSILSLFKQLVSKLVNSIILEHEC